MTGSSSQSESSPALALAAVLILFLVLSVIGIGWGLPSRSIDPYLFGGDEPWDGIKIHRLAGAAQKFSRSRGADVDPDPLIKSRDDSIALTDSDEKLAKIYLRYRLFTYQPDEMITMMALAGMNPKKLQLDPRLYQYGGLFIYPVGGLVGLCGALGIIDVRGDVVYYLDHPDEFGKFYIVSRAYAAAWGLVGVLAVFGIARRLGGTKAGLLAAVLFTLLPVVVCMAHEGKPHLPGAVLMLLAVYFGMRQLATQDSQANTDEDLTATNKTHSSHPWRLMCVSCGAAVGMVLSSWPIVALIPLIAMLDRRNTKRLATRRLSHQYRDRQGADKDENTDVTEYGNETPQEAPGTRQRIVLGGFIAAATYILVNPYILINSLTNREVLASNFGNSLAMYRIDRIAEGFVRTLQLTVEGATLPVVILGVLMLFIAIVRMHKPSIPLVVVAILFFIQFVSIGAGKPAEYGRFGIFTNTALAIAAACLLTVKINSKFVAWTKPLVAGIVIICVGWNGAGYLWKFHRDAIGDGSRVRVCHASPRGPWTGPVLQYRDRNGAAPNLESESQDLEETDPWIDLSSETTVFVAAEPAPYSCPPLPFHRLDLRLLSRTRDIETICGDRPDDCLALRTVDHTPLGPTGPPGIVIQPNPEILPRWSLPDWWFTRLQTPISWADKPIEIWTAGLPFAP